MRTRIMRYREVGFVAQYTRDGIRWHSISGFMKTDLEAACELVSFIRELKPDYEVTYTGIVDIK